MFETKHYGAVEAALMTTHGVPAKLHKAFRARLAALQKQGLLGKENQPGKGRRLSYGPDALHRLILACELLEFGVAPSLILAIVAKLWRSRLAKIFAEAEPGFREPGSDDVILHLGGVHMLADALGDAVPNVGSCRLAELPDQMLIWMRLEPDDRMQMPPRAMVVNLSIRLRAFHKVFADTYMAALLAERAAIDAKIEAATGRGKRK